ncbi:hypothetical protein KIPB_001205 [Kipferlia bialata]|uniref:Protein kinase domain-containing protein n=1 Tax=Kipferlia bialata TaxID=797122 RepID=A0A9K3CNL7_9EUKA|nr:hypothetical protein KIPB_001205 [Kipferlia bialata]|eukprot:g1205.t1
MVTRLQKVSHPALLPYTLLQDVPGVKDSPRVVFLGRPYLRESLPSRLGSRPLYSAVRAWLSYCAIRAVDAAHSLYGAHGSLSPNNLHLESGILVLTDFAPFKPQAVPMSDPAYFSFFFDALDRRDCYLSPERFQSTLDAGTPTKAGDLYALGAVLVYMWSDACPFSLSAALEIAAGRGDPREAAQCVPEALRPIVRSFLSADPSERMTTAEALGRLNNTDNADDSESSECVFHPSYATVYDALCKSIEGGSVSEGERETGAGQKPSALTPEIVHDLLNGTYRVETEVEGAVDKEREGEGEEAVAIEVEEQRGSGLRMVLGDKPRDTGFNWCPAPSETVTLSEARDLSRFQRTSTSQCEQTSPTPGSLSMSGVSGMYQTCVSTRVVQGTPGVQIQSDEDTLLGGAVYVKQEGGTGESGTRVLVDSLPLPRQRVPQRGSEGGREPTSFTRTQEERFSSHATLRDSMTASLNGGEREREEPEGEGQVVWWPSAALSVPSMPPVAAPFTLGSVCAPLCPGPTVALMRVLSRRALSVWASQTPTKVWVRMSEGETERERERRNATEGLGVLSSLAMLVPGSPDPVICECVLPLCVTLLGRLSLSQSRAKERQRREGERERQADRKRNSTKRRTQKGQREEGGSEGKSGAESGADVAVLTAVLDLLLLCLQQLNLVTALPGLLDVVLSVLSKLTPSPVDTLSLNDLHRISPLIERVPLICGEVARLGRNCNTLDSGSALSDRDAWLWLLATQGVIIDVLVTTSRDPLLRVHCGAPLLQCIHTLPLLVPCIQAAAESANPSVPPRACATFSVSLICGRDISMDPLTVVDTGDPKGGGKSLSSLHRLDIGKTYTWTDTQPQSGEYVSPGGRSKPMAHKREKESKKGKAMKVVKETKKEKKAREKREKRDREKREKKEKELKQKRAKDERDQEEKERREKREREKKAGQGHNRRRTMSIFGFMREKEREKGEDTEDTAADTEMTLEDSVSLTGGSGHLPLDSIPEADGEREAEGESVAELDASTPAPPTTTTKDGDTLHQCPYGVLSPVMKDGVMVTPTDTAASTPQVPVSLIQPVTLTLCRVSEDTIMVNGLSMPLFSEEEETELHKNLYARKRFEHSAGSEDIDLLRDTFGPVRQSAFANLRSPEIANPSDSDSDSDGERECRPPPSEGMSECTHSDIVCSEDGSESSDRLDQGSALTFSYAKHPAAPLGVMAHTPVHARQSSRLALGAGIDALDSIREEETDSDQGENTESDYRPHNMFADSPARILEDISDIDMAESTIIEESVLSPGPLSPSGASALSPTVSANTPKADTPASPTPGPSLLHNGPRPGLTRRATMAPMYREAEGEGEGDMGVTQEDRRRTATFGTRASTLSTNSVSKTGTVRDLMSGWMQDLNAKQFDDIFDSSEGEKEGAGEAGADMSSD